MRSRDTTTDSGFEGRLLSSAQLGRGVIAALAGAALVSLAIGGSAAAQTTRFPSGSATPVAPTSPVAGAPVDVPQTNLTPIGPPAVSAPPPSATLGNPLFDPYTTGAGAGTYQPALPPGTLPPAPATSGLGSGGLLGGLFSRSASTPAAPGAYSGFPAPGTGTPLYGSPAGATPWQASPYGNPPGFATPGYPNTIYPSGTPSSLFPGGLFGGGTMGNSSTLTAYRFLQGPRIRHSFINAGDDPNDVEINDTDVSVAFAFPNFLYSNQPVYVVPSFSLHLWDGPKSTIGADLPAAAYSAFVDTGWQTDPNQILGLELGLRVGAFTDFDTFNRDSIRILGKALASFRLTPASTLKLGAYYIDRNKVKFLPAGGLLYQPNPYSRYDLFFPQPKLAHYWRTLGTYDVWCYLSGEYGGGAWTIERANGQEDSIDMNDLRVFAGFEWGHSDAIRAGRRIGFFEVGYVFDRKVRYRYNPDDNFDPDDAFFVRAGIGY